MERVKGFLVTRDASGFPSIKLALNEVGVIMPDDNNPNRDSLDADLPSIYWNAAGAMFAYLFVKLVPLGVEILGQSQLAGSRKISEWGIPLRFQKCTILGFETAH